MPKIKIDKETMENILYEDHDTDAEVISDSVSGNGRWSIHHALIFKYIDGKVYRTYYNKGATEYQDEDPWYDKEVECTEVHLVEKVVQVYEPVPDA